MSTEIAPFVAAGPGRSTLSGSLQAAYLPVLKALVGLAFDRKAGEIESPLREQQVAKARQVGIYLAHTVLQLNMTQAGEAFNRDRTTASYACRMVEDARDEPAFNALVSACEQSLLTLPALMAQRSQPTLRRRRRRLPAPDVGEAE